MWTVSPGVVLRVQDEGSMGWVVFMPRVEARVVVVRRVREK